MSDKHKGMVNEHGRSVRREKMVPVAPGSRPSPAGSVRDRQAATGIKGADLLFKVHRSRLFPAGCGVRPRI